MGIFSCFSSKTKPKQKNPPQVKVNNRQVGKNKEENQQDDEQNNYEYNQKGIKQISKSQKKKKNMEQQLQQSNSNQNLTIPSTVNSQNASSTKDTINNKEEMIETQRENNFKQKQKNTNKQSQKQSVKNIKKNNRNKNNISSEEESSSDSQRSGNNSSDSSPSQKKQQKRTNKSKQQQQQQKVGERKKSKTQGTQIVKREKLREQSRKASKSENIREQSTKKESKKINKNDIYLNVEDKKNAMINSEDLSEQECEDPDLQLHKKINQTTPQKKTPLQNDEQYDFSDNVINSSSNKSNNRNTNNNSKKQQSNKEKDNTQHKNISVMTNELNSQDSTKYSINATCELEKLPQYNTKEELKKFVQKQMKILQSQDPKDKIKLEQELIKGQLGKKVGDQYILSMTFADQYSNYLEQKLQDQPPGKINNKILLDSKGELRLDVKSNDHYVLINEYLWVFISKMYGGGPEINYSKIEQQQSKMSMEMNSSLSLEPVGLQNNQYYCYMNAVLQCLTSIPQLNSYFSEQKYKGVKNTKKSLKFTLCHNDLICQMANANRKGQYYANPTSIKKQIRKFFDPSEQHDSQEFLRFYLSEIQDELTPQQKQKKQSLVNQDVDSRAAYKSYLNTHPSIIDRLFTGLLQSQVECQRCKHISSTFEPFLDLSLSIQYSKYTKQGRKYQNRQIQIQDCLDAFFEKEDLCDDYKCEKCKHICKAKRQFKISATPKILTIHLKRFKSYPYPNKISEIVQYPLNKFDVLPYCDESITKNNARYKLIGLVEHSGGQDYGHYTAYNRRGKS